MVALVRRLIPFRTRDGRRYAVLFAVVYFAQGMWYLPNQTVTIVLKDAGFSAGMIANFFVVSAAPRNCSTDNTGPAGSAGEAQAIKFGSAYSTSGRPL